MVRPVGTRSSKKEMTDLDEALEKEEAKKADIKSKLLKRKVELSDIDRAKVLLVYIYDLLDNDPDKLNIIYQVRGTSSIMSLYFFKNDLQITLVKPINITSLEDKIPDDSEKKVRMFVKRISAYGSMSYLRQTVYEDEILQPFLKNLYYKLIDLHHKQLLEIDDLLNQVLSSPEKNTKSINNTIVDNETGINSFTGGEDLIKDRISRFDSNNIEMSRFNGRHRIFF